MRQDEKAIFKFNSGHGALLCSKCRVIIKTGIDFTEEEIMAIKGKLDMPPQYCKQCKPDSMEAKEKASALVLKFMSKVVSKNVAKECAIIAVDEVILNIEPSVSMDVISARIKYWEEVKKEIEAL